jgi:hypothetical protein
MYFVDKHGLKYRIVFAHFSDNIPKYDRSDDPGVTTECSLRPQRNGKDDKETSYLYGIAHCCSKDKNLFVKDKGRKLALFRVLNTYFDREDRKKAWETYHNRKKSS